MATIYKSTKFHHAHEQYCAIAGGYTLLRLTLGAINGEPGGAIKTATASDFETTPIYHDRETLIEVMRNVIQDLGGRTENVDYRNDKKGRQFGEIRLSGSRKEIMEFFRQFTEKIGSYFT